MGNRAVTIRCVTRRSPILPRMTEPKDLENGVCCARIFKRNLRDRVLHSGNNCIDSRLKIGEDSLRGSSGRNSAILLWWSHDFPFSQPVVLSSRDYENKSPLHKYYFLGLENLNREACHSQITALWPDTVCGVPFRIEIPLDLMA